MYCSNKVGLKQMPKPEELQDFINDLKKINSEIITTVGKYKQRALGPFICDSPLMCDLKHCMS